MESTKQKKFACFSGERLLAHGSMADVAIAAKTWSDEGTGGPTLIFSDESGHLVDLDLRGSPSEVLERLQGNHGAAAPTSPQRRGPGRPKLGVISKEVTLLPRHWEWLGEQPGGASVTLRKLVDAARKGGGAADTARRSQEAAYRFMAAMAGNHPGFEEASRALFAHDFDRFGSLVEPWPVDVRDHLRRLVATAARDHALATDA